jgi:hypothetical protein
MRQGMVSTLTDAYVVNARPERSFDRKVNVPKDRRKSLIEWIGVGAGLFSGASARRRYIGRRACAALPVADRNLTEP